MRESEVAPVLERDDARVYEGRRERSRVLLVLVLGKFADKGASMVTGGGEEDVNERGAALKGVGVGGKESILDLYSEKPAQLGSVRMNVWACRLWAVFVRSCSRLVQRKKETGTTVIECQRVLTQSSNGS